MHSLPFFRSQFHFAHPEPRARGSALRDRARGERVSTANERTGWGGVGAVGWDSKGSHARTEGASPARALSNGDPAQRLRACEGLQEHSHNHSSRACEGVQGHYFSPTTRASKRLQQTEQQRHQATVVADTRDYYCPDSRYDLCLSAESLARFPRIRRSDTRRGRPEANVGSGMFAARSPFTLVGCIPRYRLTIATTMIFWNVIIQNIFPPVRPTQPHE